MGKSGQYGQVALLKVGWAEEYTGDVVLGRHKYIKAYGDAHERFNFLRAPDGRLYGYVHPVGGQRSAPRPAQPTGWLVLFVAPLEGDGPLVPVGWYENACFEDEWRPRPEYDEREPLPLDTDGDPYTFIVHADDGSRVPRERRTRYIVPGRPHFGRTPILYVRGVAGDGAAWRRRYAAIAEAVIRGETSSRRPPSFSGTAGFADAAHSRKVERAAVRAVRRILKRRGYEVVDRQRDRCGYDLLARRGRAPAELHVEVKGTSSSEPHFFMTPNEKAYMADPRWRLGMVTNAVARPSCRLFTLRQAEAAFVLSPLVWEGRQRSP